MAPPNTYGSNYGLPVGRQVIKSLGGKVTQEKLRFFEAWARAEGTKAQYNPFATTRKGYPGETQFNPVGVKNYPDLQTGVQATVDTLRLDYYKHIVQLLRQNDTTAKQLAEAVASSPWGTGTGVLRVLGVSEVDGYEKVQSTAQYGAKKKALDQSYIEQAVTRFTPSESYLQQLSSMGRGGEALSRFAAKSGTLLQQREPRAPEVTPYIGAQTKFKPGKILLPGTSWAGTHVTDNLGWDTKTATDIMASPGTPVGAPEAGIIVRHGSAQGGQSLYFQGRSGAEYWLGHIDDMLPVGTKVKAGQPIAVISSDHAAPHLHIDRRGGSPKKKK